MADPKQPSQDVMRLALTRHGMYSPLEKAANAVPRTKGTGAEFMAEASKQAGFRPEEVADRNLKLPEGKMNKQEFLNHIQGTNMPWVTEHKLSDMGDEGEQPQYSEYQLPGGRNYREILLQTPSSKEDPYHSSHWEGVPNVLAHMRMSYRKTDDNKKLLHLEELQSDWHQQGRKMGYAPKGGGLHDAAEQAARKHRQLQHKLHEARLNSDSVELRMESAPTPEQREMHKKLMDKYNRDVMDLMPQTMKAEDEALKAKMLASSSVPDAPFKKNWHELGMKHVLHHAAKNGYSGVVITPGDEQAKRWQDEGLKVHYDQKIPEYLNKFGKQFGVKVGQVPLSGDINAKQGQQDDDLLAQLGVDVPKAEPTPLHHFPITEPMRQHILTQGLPMYRSGGIIHKA